MSYRELRTQWYVNAKPRYDFIKKSHAELRKCTQHAWCGMTFYKNVIPTGKTYNLIKNKTHIMIFDYIKEIKHFAHIIKNLIKIIYNILHIYFVKFNFN